MSDSIKTNIQAFKRKYYLNKLIRGTLLSGILFGSILLIFSSLEGFLWLGQAVRMSFLGILSGTLLLALVWGVIIPLSGLFQLRKGITNEEAAMEVGKHFPEVSDKLLNYLQLEKLNRSEKSLVNAALQQKTNELKIIPFQHAVNLNVNLKYTYTFLAVLLFFTLVSFISPGFLSSGSSRILQFNKEFERPAPFQFVIPEDLTAFKNESFELNVKIDGEYLPEDVFLLDNNRKIRLNRSGNGSYKFLYPSISEDKQFQLEAAGFRSTNYKITVYERPEILDFRIDLDYPAHTGIRDKVVNNTGSLIVPEGTSLTWTLNTSEAELVELTVNDKTQAFIEKDEQEFTFSKRAFDAFDYEIGLQNRHARNKSRIAYEVSVIEDQFPELEVEFLLDTITYNSVLVSGNIVDDYGFQRLQLFYRINRTGDYSAIRLNFDPKQNNQQFFYQLDLDSLSDQNSGVELFVSVADNDAINKYKESRSQTFYFKIPDEKELEQLVENAGNKTQSQFNEAEKKSETLNDKLQELEDRLKNKKELSWQDEKLLEDVIKDKEELQKSIEELKKKHEELMRSQKEFGKQSEDLRKKSEQLQELIEESMDNETQKLYEELQKLLKEKAGSDQVLNKLSNVKKKERNLEKELERMKELFNRLNFESKLEQASKKLEELSQKQEELADETKKQEREGNSDENRQKLSEEQQKLNEEFEDVKKDIDKSEELNQKLKNPQPFENFNKEEQEIQEKLDEIPENLKNNDLQKAGQQQQNAGQKMKKMSKSMQSMQSSMEMIVMQENIDQLRDILDNLIKLSFEQEKLVNSFQAVQQVDPRFIELSQDQLKLIENSEVIEDSLLSLASRVVQISNFVTREVDEINTNLDKAMNELRERNKGKATSHQQFAMTSMNNLALLLDDVLSQMQMAMAEAMGQPQKAGQKESALPDMSELQKQLSEQIQQLKKSGKSGRQLSEELARLAAEQAEIRRQMESMQEKMAGQPGTEEDEDGKDGGGGDGLKEAIEKMEENEVDLVNKRLTEELIERQQEILTRMLEAEESMREQKESPEREGETAKENIRKVPPEFEEYLKAKRSEIELLKTIPLDLNPFYKKEVNDYFRRLSGED